MTTPTPDTRPGAPGKNPATDAYTRADKVQSQLDKAGISAGETQAGL